MANQGLRKCIQQKQVNIGSATANINGYSADANIILVLPILSTVGFAPINISLIYNQQNKNEQELFGKGFKLNYYSKLEYISGSEIRIKNSDGSITSYTVKNGNYLTNKETHLKVRQSYYTDDETGDTIYYYDLLDNSGNCITYEESNLNYPARITPKSNENIYFDFNSNQYTITNMNSDTIHFTKGTSGFVETIEWKHNKESRITATLGYTNGTLVSIIVKNSSPSKDAILASYSLKFENTLIEVLDNQTGANTKFTLNGNKVTKIEEGFNGKYNESLITTISYNGTRTTITNPHQKVSTIVYDKEGLTRLVKDDKENFMAYTYDMDTKALLAETPLPKPNQVNNLLNGKSISNFTRYGSISLTTNHEDIDALYQAHAGTKSSYLYGNSYATYRFAKNFLPTDTITLIIWAKQTMPCVPGSVSGYARLASGNRYSDYYFNKPIKDDEYFPFIMGFTFTEAASYLDISIYFSTYFGLEIGSIQLYKRSFGAFYQYDSEGNVISSTVSGNEKKFTYANGVMEESRSLTSHGIKYTRDSRQRVTKAVGAYQTKQTLTYTSKNQVKTSKTENFDSTAIFETSCEYLDNDKRVIYKDELGNTSIEESDNFLNVIKTTNQVNQILKSTLSDSFELENLELLSGTTPLLNASYTYYPEHHNLVKTITMKNGMKYSFVYDAKDRVTSISLNDILLVSYTYDKYDQILTLKYGNSSNVISFTYTDYEQIKTVNTGTKTYTYNYNDLGSLISITDDTNIWQYTYNEDNKVEEFTLKQSSQKIMGVQYEYDNLGNVNKEQENIFDFKHIKEYEGLYRSNGCNAENLSAKLQERSDFFSCMFIGNDVCLRNKNTSFKAYIYDQDVETSPTTMDEAVPCISVGSNAFKYKFDSARTYAGSFGFWYKFSYLANSPVLLRIGSASQYIHLFINNNHKLAVQVKDSTGSVSTVYTSTFAAGAGGWHFLGINWYCDSNTTSFMLMFDGEIVTFSVSKNIKIVTQEYIMFYTASGKVSGVISGNNQILSVNHFILFYRSTLDYVFNKVKQNDSLDFSCTTHYLAPSDFTLYPLHHDLKSLDGKLPYKYGLRNVIVADTDKTFNYNSAIGRYAYIADGAELDYDLNNSGSGTVALRAYIKSNLAQKQYLFELYDTQTAIALYIDADKKICIECLGKTITTTLSIIPGGWYFIGFTFTPAIASDSATSNIFSTRLVVEGNEYTSLVTIGRSVSKLYCSLGRKHNATTISTTTFGSYEETYPLHGQIEMLCINKNYSSLATLTALKTNLELSNKITGYNEFGMLASSAIKANQKEITSKTIAYKSKPSTSSTQDNKKNKCLDIASESIFLYGRGTNTRNYVTDNLGRLTKVTDSLFGDHEYSYDEKGYLKKEDKTDFTYDANGNITKAGTKEYEYSGKIKDRLTKALGFDVSYDSDNPGNPTDWNGRNYNWDHSRRLLKFEHNEVETTYTYNAEGLRTSKTHISTTTEYFYSGNRLIAEKNPSYKLNFLYDENGLLYGFIKDNSTKYFYIRDVYQNILGIIDNTGALMVKYSYDAWGNHKVLDSNGNVNTSNSFIGNINPFRYKGYYYDKESNMYYCKNRYYVPEWCRWLNADSIGFLNPQNIYELNLFAYCKNNPVMNVDPSGDFAISALIVGAIIGLAVEFAIDLLEDKSRTIDHSFWDYVGAAVGGAISGGLGSSSNVLVRLTGAIIGSVVQGAISENVNYNMESFKRDSIIGVVSFGISEVLSILGKRLLNGWLDKTVNSTTKKASQQITRLRNGNVANNLVPNAQKVEKMLIIFSTMYKVASENMGAFYSFITGIFHGTIINW